MLLAKQYQNTNVVPRQNAKDLLSKFAHRICWRPDGNDVVLDVGCGTGNVTWELLRPLLPPAARLIGLDVSVPLINFARKQYPELEVIIQDIGAPQMPDSLLGEVDHIFSCFCLHWIKDQRKGMTNLFNLLKPGGDMLLCYLANNSINDVTLKLSKTHKWKPYITDIDNYMVPFLHLPDNDAVLKKIMQDIGFENIVLHLEDKVHEYENINIYTETISTVNPIYSQLPDNMKEEFNIDFLHEISKIKMIEVNCVDKKETLFCNYKTFSIYATKPMHKLI